MTDVVAAPALAADPRALGLPAVDAKTARRVQLGPETGFGPDGFPHRVRPDGSAVPHPILGSYLLRGYLDTFETSGRSDHLAAASLVAQGALARMEEFKGTRVLWQQPDWGLSSWVHRQHYSGLTQSYYAVELARLGQFSNDKKILKQAEQVMRSLLVPVDDGGVLVTANGLMAFEESPSQPVGLALNGWLSILGSIAQYAQLTGSDEWRQTLETGLTSLERALPWYDVERLALSRSSLQGYQYVRLRMGADGTRLRSAHVEVPGSSPVEVLWGPGARGRGRYQSSFNEGDVDGQGTLARATRANLVLSRFGYPVRNALVLELDSVLGQRCSIDVQTTRYEPEAAAPVTEGWQRVATFAVAPGVSTTRIELPWSALPLVGFPVNFRKRTPSGVSASHDVHVKRLESLGDEFGRPVLTGWAQLWREYQKRWPEVPELAGLFGAGDGAS